MAIDSPLVAVSPVLYLLLAIMFYAASWALVSAVDVVLRERLRPVDRKDLFAAGLVGPIVLAAAPILGGLLFAVGSSALAVHHHSAACRMAYDRVTEVHWGKVGSDVDALSAGIGWVSVASACIAAGRIAWASVMAENVLARYARPATPALLAAIRRIRRTNPRIREDRFLESAIPPESSCVVGLIRPRCLISADLAAKAAPDELDAVVSHEAAHLSAGDIYATYLVAVLRATLFWLPPVKSMAISWRREAELACDDAAVRATGRPLAVAAAILRVAGSPPPRRGIPIASAPYASHELCALEIRIERLLAQAQCRRATKLLPPRCVRLTVLLLAAGMVGACTFLAAWPGLACYAHCTLEAFGRILP